MYVVSALLLKCLLISLWKSDIKFFQLEPPSLEDYFS